MDSLDSYIYIYELNYIMSNVVYELCTIFIPSITAR